MTRNEFLGELRGELSELNENDIQLSLDFYGEMINDGIEDGLSEEEAVASLGSPSEIAKQIFIDMPLSKLVKAKVKPKRSLRAWEIVLLILGSPVWLPLLAAAAIIILSVYIVLWSLVLALYSIGLAVAATAAGGFAVTVGYFIRGNIAGGVFILGAACLCAGLSVLMLFGFNQVTRGMVFISKKILLGIKYCFVGRRAKNEKV